MDQLDVMKKYIHTVLEYLCILAIRLKELELENVGLREELKNEKESKK